MASYTKTASGLSLVGSFEEIALEWFETKIKPLSASHSNRTMAYLKNDLIPYLGKLPMNEIKAPALLECLRRIEARKNKQGKPVTETANRVREQMGQLWRYAIAIGKAERDIAADLRGALEAHVQKNFSHITDPKLLGQLMRDVETYSGAPVTVAALRILPLVFTRSMELRTARWADIDLETKEWRYFSTKTKIDHIVPLANQVVELLESLQPLTGMGEYVFGVRAGQRPLSEITINQALKSLGYGGDVIHPHGFRHTAATMLAEMGWDEHHRPQIVAPSARCQRRVPESQVHRGQAQDDAGVGRSLRPAIEGGYHYPVTDSLSKPKHTIKAAKPAAFFTSEANTAQKKEALFSKKGCNGVTDRYKRT